MSVEQYQFFNNCTPLIDSGSLPVGFTVNQTMSDLTHYTGPTQVWVKVNGPQFALTESDLAGVYPAPGSDDSPADYLPHIALTRRTLPWERKGPANAKPWLALLLVKDSELNLGASTTVSGQAWQAGNGVSYHRRVVPKGPSVVAGTVGSIASRDPVGYAAINAVLPNNPPVNILYLQNATFVALRPTQAELPLLCNLKRTNKGDGDIDCAIVVGNRLPDATGPDPESHTAFLVSLEGRTDAYSRSGAGEIALIYLHSWSFKPSTGGDFEQVVRSIGIRPNGGVLRFGNLPSDVVAPAAALISGGFEALLDSDGLFIDGVPHTQNTNATFRGPLRPFDTDHRSAGFAVRSAPEEFNNAQPGEREDYSHAAAYELGRMLALASLDVLDDLREIHGTVDVMTPEVAINKLPIALQKPEWVTDPAWISTDLWAFQVNKTSVSSIATAISAISKNSKEFVGATPGDVAGISQQIAQIGAQVTLDLIGLQAPMLSVVTSIDIAAIDIATLNRTFSITAAKAH